MKEKIGWGQRVYIEDRTGQGEGASLEGANSICSTFIDLRNKVDQSGEGTLISNANKASSYLFRWFSVLW